MSLIGKTFLDSTFVQDPMSAYIKIDNVVIGESQEFGYKSVFTKDIGQLLKDCLTDSSVVAILYNWNGKVGYLKKGFKLAVASDSAKKSGFTTFIVKDRISSDNIKFFDNDKPVAIPVPPINNPTPPPTSNLPFRINEFVRINGSKIELNGRPFVPVGVNAFFLGLLQETMQYPSKTQVTEVIEAVRRMKGTVIRSHTLGFSAETSVSLIGANNKFNDNAWDIIDFAMSEAKRCSIKLIIPLCDPYEYYHGSLKTFCAPSGTPKEQFFTHPAPRAEFKKYITSYLNHVNKYTGVAIKDSLEIAFLELGNELGNIRPNSGSTTKPTRDWMVDITKHIKSVDRNHLVLNGSDECLGESNDFSVTEIDCFQSHFYWKDWNRIKRDAAASLKVNRPYIIGESDSRWGDDWYKAIEAIPNMCGSCPWSLYPHENGDKTKKRIEHNDGFTFWYDAQTGDNVQTLLRMTNHFRRMQGLPETNVV